MTRKENLELTSIFYRTIRNCQFYEREKDLKKLLNEIGCLRGIAYSLEALGSDLPYNDKEFARFIDLQEKLKAVESIL